MYRELRITILIVLVGFIYGLMTFLSSGGFATPYFFSKLILLGASLIFFFLNLKEKGRGYLLLAFLAMLSYSIGDEATINLVTKGGQRIALEDFFNSQLLITASFIVFFAFYYVVLFPLHKVLNRFWIAPLLALLLSFSIVFIILQWYFTFQLIFSLFLIIYFVLVFRKSLPENSVLNVLSALFLLQILLELFKYLP